MATLAKVVSDYFMLMRGQDLVEGFADKPKREKIGGPTMGEDQDLDFDREAPRRQRICELKV